MLSIKYVMFFLKLTATLGKFSHAAYKIRQKKEKKKTSVSGTIFFRWDCIVSGNNPFQNAINSC